MQQVNAQRKRLGGGGQWFRIGLASATVMTPLITRWNDLRAAERARALADEAEARLRDVRARVVWPPQSRQAQREALDKVHEVSTQMGRNRGKVSTNVWLIGVGVGLVAAGTGAYVIVRRKMAQAMEEPLVDLPTASKNGNSAQMRETARAMARNGTAPTMGAARSAAPTTMPTRPPAPIPPTATAIPEDGIATATATPQPTTPVLATPAELPGAAAETDSGAPAGGVDANEAAFIGNIRTMVYHEAGAGNLPAEENRIYFASEDEARQAGYRRDRDEVTGGETRATGETSGGAGA